MGPYLQALFGKMHLRSLSLENARISDNDLLSLGANALPSLVSLSLATNRGIVGRGLEAILAAAPEQEQLNVACPRLDTRFLSPLACRSEDFRRRPWR